jgi:ATP-grasp domain
LRCAELALQVPHVAEMDINPLMATPGGAVAVDCRIRVVPWTQHPERDIRRLP